MPKPGKPDKTNNLHDPCASFLERCSKLQLFPPQPGPPPPPPVGCPCGNLVENGSFDDWNTAPEGWDVVVNVGQEDNNVHTLPFAAQLGVPPNTNDEARLGQDIDAQAGCCYRFEFHATGSSNQAFRAQVLFDDTVVSEILIPAVVQPQYSYFSTYTPCVPPGTEVSILFIKPGTGSLFVDDVGFVAEGPCVVPTQ